MKWLRTGDWILVADGEQAMFLENTGDTETPTLTLRAREEQTNPPSHDQGTDRPGRRMDNGVGQRSALQETDFHQQAKDRFADGLAARIGERARQGDFSRLVLVAAPSVLGEIRQQLDDEGRACIVAEVAKALTNHPLPEIARLLQHDLSRA